MQGAQVRNHALGPADCSDNNCAHYSSNNFCTVALLRAEGYRIILLNSNPVSAHMWIYMHRVAGLRRSLCWACKVSQGF